MAYKPPKKPSYQISIVIRVVFLLLSITGLSWTFINANYYASSLFLFLIIVAQAAELIAFTSRNNAEMVRFLTALRYADYGQRFQFGGLSANFAELGTAFSDVLEQFQLRRANYEKEFIHLEALIEHSPVPLMSVYSGDQVVLWNHSARLFFSHRASENLSDFDYLGPEFTTQLAQLKGGDQAVVNCNIDGTQQRFLLIATQILVGEEMEKLVSLQNIHGELEVAKLQAWGELVRVLTHEVMNSVTPVTSLAQTTVDLVADVSRRARDDPTLTGELADIGKAVQTIARRSDHLTQFIGSYRQLTDLAEPEKQPVSVADLFEQLSMLLTAQWDTKGISLITEINPGHLELMIDRGMVEQALLNLLKNAEDALQNQVNAKVSLKAYRNSKGRICMDIEDNGCGITEAIADKIFVPFYTTKRQGTGVGLALVRQIMMAHGGAVRLVPQKAVGSKVGALFILTF